MRRVGAGLGLGVAVGLVFGYSAHGARSRAARKSQSRSQAEARVPVVLPASPLDLYLLAGQSNASGRGELEIREPPVPSAYLFGNDYRWRHLSEPSDDAEGQVDVISTDHNAGYSFASSFAAAMGRPLAIIPCASGGTGIGEWRPDTRDTTLYGSLLKRVGASRPCGRLRALLWYQGERDAADFDSAHHWRERFEGLVAGLRRDLSEPHLPVAFAQLTPGTPPDHSAWEVVRSQQAAVRIAGVRLVSTDALPVSPDGLHLTRAAQQELGRRFAAAVKGGGR